MKECSIFLCEDTATTKKLLNMYQISLEKKEFYAYTSFTNPSKLNHYLNIITSNDVCVLSEAGTPGLSDPGKSIIKLAWENNISFEVLPGASALIPSIVSAYTDTSNFVFDGFLPLKKGRQTMLKNIINNCNTTKNPDAKPHFFYESVHRIEKFLQEVDSLWFDGTIYISREMSKMFEQKLMWTARELLNKIHSGELIIKWEFVVGMWK